MPKKQSARIQDHLAELTDPRKREVTHPLINIVVLAICAVICGADDFVAIAKFGRTSAWATANHISLGQVVVDATSNEITAIPKLLEMLELQGAIVTIDALGCQWGIENNLHWQLEVTFQEDLCPVRCGHADANLSILRWTALSRLKNEATLKVGIKNNRLTAGWDEGYLEKVLFC